MEITRVGDRLAFAAQPSAADLRELHRIGFRTLVNVRLDGEQPASERAEAERMGFHYVHIPIAQPEWSERAFAALDRVLRLRDRGVLVHSGEGARAGVLALACHAAAQGWSVDRLFAAARRLGLDLPAAAVAWVERRGHAVALAPETSSSE